MISLMLQEAREQEDPETGGTCNGFLLKLPRQAHVVGILGSQLVTYLKGCSVTLFTSDREPTYPQ